MGLLTKTTGGQKGLNAIEKVLGDFNNMVSDLQSGVDKVHAQKADNEAEITRLTEENAELEAGVVQAANLMKGLKIMMNGGSVVSAEPTSSD